MDSSDRERLEINKVELLAMLAEEELVDAKLLVFANKQVGPFVLTFSSPLIIVTDSALCYDRINRTL